MLPFLSVAGLPVAETVLYTAMDEQKLVRFFAGLSSEEEQREVRAWIEANPSFRRTIDAGPDTAWDADRAAASLTDRIRPTKHRPERQPDHPPEYRPTTRRFTQRDRTASSLFRYGAGVVLVVMAVMAGLWLSNPSPPSASPTAEHDEIITERGQRTTLHLPDDTEIVLNAESRLHILNGYARERREIYLQGEAFFDVAHQPNLPFILHTDEATVRVLGTAFSVSAYTEQGDVQVAVAEGRVSLHSVQEAARDTVVLQPRDLGIVSMGSLTVHHNVSLDRYHAWTEGRLVFEATPMEEVARELERWFDVQIHFADRTLKDRRLTGEFKDQSLDNILNIIAFTLDAQFEREGKKVTFSS